MNPTLRDYLGDLWEVLPESGYVPRQDEDWARYQDEAMRTEADALVAERVMGGEVEDEAAEHVWRNIMAARGFPRVYVREVPHEQSSGTSPDRGPRGVYEVLEWLGAGGGMFVPGAMNRMLVRPSARWYAELIEAAEANLAGLPEDADRDAIEADIGHNKRALRIASLATGELWITDMNRRIRAELEAEAAEGA